MGRFTKQQPHIGDTILHCGHLEKKPHHFFSLTVDKKTLVGFQFFRPDGTTGIAKWMVLCTECFPIHCGDPTMAMRADCTWNDPDAVIQEPNIQ